jgi:hypothetical protein
LQDGWSKKYPLFQIQAARRSIGEQNCVFAIQLDRFRILEVCHLEVTLSIQGITFDLELIDSLLV